LLAKCRRSDRSARILRYGRLQAGANFQAMNSTAPLSSTILAGPLASCAYRALSHLWSAYHPNSRRSAGTTPSRFHNLSDGELPLAMLLVLFGSMPIRKQRAAPNLRYVHGAPGHLMRRSQQIAVALFFEELDGFSITPPQYASLVAIMDRPGVDQRRLADLVAIDRSTIGVMLQRLEKKGLILRVTPEADQRVRRLFITAPGRDLLVRSRKAIERAQQRILAPLSPRERSEFLRMLTKLVQLNNDSSRVPLKVRGTTEIDLSD